jgi:uncharacterized protein
MSAGMGKRALDWWISGAWKECDHLHLVFYGGEPLLQPDLIAELAEYASVRSKKHHRPLHPHVLTNGVLLGPDVLEQMVGADVRVRISIDGGRATQERGRPTPDGQPYYDGLQSNLRGLLARCPSAAVRMTLTPSAAPQVREDIGALRALGVQRFELGFDQQVKWPLHAFESLEQQLMTVATQHVDALISGEHRFWVRNIEAAMRRALRHSSPLRCCGAGRTTLAVDPFGMVYPCHHFAFLDSPDVWGMGEFGRPLRSDILARLEEATHSLRGSSGQACSECPLSGHCTAGCFAMNQQATGDPGTIPDPDQSRLFALLDRQLGLSSALRLNKTRPELAKRISFAGSTRAPSRCGNEIPEQ